MSARIKNAQARAREPDTDELYRSEKARADLAHVLYVFTTPSVGARWIDECFPDLEGEDRWNTESDFKKFHAKVVGGYYTLPRGFPENSAQEGMFRFLWESETPFLDFVSAWWSSLKYATVYAAENSKP